MRRLLNVVRLSCATILALVVVIGGSLYALGGRLYSVQTGSMMPTFYPGDAVLVRHTHNQRFTIGEVITFHDAWQPNRLLTHRITAIDAAHNQVTTKGDHLKVSDSPVADTQIVGKVLAVAPGLGKVAAKARSLIGLLVMVYLPALVLLYFELAYIFSRPHRTYRLPVH